MSEQPDQNTGAVAPDRAGGPDTDLAAGAPGPSGTGSFTDAGADPDAPAVERAQPDPGAAAS